MCAFNHMFKNTNKQSPAVNRREQNSAPVGEDICPSEKSLCPQRATFDLPSWPQKRDVDRYGIGPHIHSLLHCDVRLFSLYDLRLFGAPGPAVAQGDEDAQDEEQNRKDCHYGDVAGVGQRRAVGSLGRNHVGQVQHVAQRPAGITAFNLDMRQRGRGKAQLLAAKRGAICTE